MAASALSGPGLVIKILTDSLKLKTVLSWLEAISNPPEADWVKIAAGFSFHANPDDPSIFLVQLWAF
jgi:hypothetical protein